MHCIQCKRPLAMQTSANGLAATCDHCGIEHLSLGRLMSLSDSTLLTGIWAIVQEVERKGEAQGGWKKSQACPRCSKSTVGVPFNHAGKQHALIVCNGCYLVTMKKDTLTIFREQNSEFQEQRREETRVLAKQKFDADLRRDIDSAKVVLNMGIRTANRLMTETPLREIRATVTIAVGATLLSLFTMLLPYSSMEVFGNPSSFSLFTVLTHVTFFHLAWNLIFFCALSATMERESGLVKHVVSLALISSLAISLGRIISPFPDAPMIGLSPVIGALIGRHLVLGLPTKIYFPNSKLGVVLESRTVAVIFLISEFRTMIPSSGGMRWFTLSSFLAAGFISAAYAEWDKRRVMNAAGARRTVHVHPQIGAGTTMPVKTSKVSAPAKKVA